MKIVFLIIILAYIAALASELESGPYIQPLDISTYQINFTTKASIKSELVLVCDNMIMPVTPLQNTTVMHKYLIKYLSSLKNCAYSINAVNNINNTSFPIAKDIPLKIYNPLKDIIKILYVSDIHSSDYFQYFHKHINTFDPDFIIDGGDKVQDGPVLQDWLDYFKYASPILKTYPILTVIGNHEFRDSTLNYSQYYFDVRKTNYYDFKIKNIRIVNLDANVKYISNQQMQEQLKWLKYTLENASNLHETIIVVMHESPITSGLSKYQSETKWLRDNMFPLFIQYGVKLVLAGHDHIFEHLEQDNVNIIINPSIKSNFYVITSPFGVDPSSRFMLKTRGVSLIEISEDNILLKLIDSAGVILYSLQI